MAAVMSHELAHIIAKHHIETYSTYKLRRLRNYDALCAELHTPPRHIENTRIHEYEADELGLTLMAQAGYDPFGQIYSLKNVEWREKQEEERRGRYIDWGNATHPPVCAN